MSGAATICRAVGCINVQPCADHPPRRPFENAPRSSDLYGSARWKRERKAFLRANPKCVWRILGDFAIHTGELCGANATTVDHTPPHRGDPVKFWDRSTWRALCARHHNRNTGREVAARRKATK